MAGALANSKGLTIEYVPCNGGEWNFEDPRMVHM